MTPEDLQAWIEARGLSRNKAARELGISIDRLRRFLDGTTDPIPEYIALACSAIAFGLPPYRKPE